MYDFKNNWICNGVVEMFYQVDLFSQSGQFLRSHFFLNVHNEIDFVNNLPSYIECERYIRYFRDN